MRLQATLSRPTELSQAALVAYRQIWLASLGAAAVSRDWIQHGAGSTFRVLVREGTAVESKAIRVLENQFGPSLARAGSLLRQTGSSVRQTVRSAGVGAVSFVREKLPVVKIAVQPAPTATPARARKVKATSVRAKTTAAKRGAKKAAKRSAR